MSVRSVTSVRITLIAIALCVGLLVGCPEQKPLPEGACPTCRGTGKISTTTPVYIGESPGQPGGPGQPNQPGQPMYRYDTSTSECKACGGTGKKDGASKK